LVGKTDTTFNTAGIALRSEDVLQVTRSGATPLEINRTTNDGKIAEFYKDGATVGSIGTNGGRLSIGSGDVNLNFNASANAMYPISDTAGTLSDGIVDMGAATARFKDLFIGGDIGHLDAANPGNARLLYDRSENLLGNTGTNVTGVTISSSSDVEVGRQVTGGFGAHTTAGTTDWNHSTNARPGMGYTLLLGTATNGPGGAHYYHSVSYEYSTKNGTGNLIQFAYGYNINRQWQRLRVSGTWGSWSAVL
jgi:hypothetical protein